MIGSRSHLTTFVVTSRDRGLRSVTVNTWLVWIAFVNGAYRTWQPAATGGRVDCPRRFRGEARPALRRLRVRIRDLRCHLHRNPFTNTRSLPTWSLWVYRMCWRSGETASPRSGRALMGVTSWTTPLERSR
jgi:hypothetical protein